MLSKADNEFLTRSGPGTPMGDLLRRFWMPALLSEELPERDGPPRKIKILGEDLLAFRSTDGRVGIVEPHCPHRGANLYFGRNEECGLRCAFHGWKFDVDGNCVDLPTSPPESSYKDTIKLLAYPTREWGDMIWVYMGPRDRMPELPQIEMGLVPAASRYVTKKWQDCNWVQSVEGALDTSHFSFLHMVLSKDDATARAAMAKAAIADQTKPDDRIRWVQNDPRPKFQVMGHDTGLVIGGARKTDGPELYWRISQFLMPNHAYTPTAFPGEIYYGQCWVPVDDVTCWIYTYSWHPDRPFTNSERAKFDERLQRPCRGRRRLPAAAQPAQRVPDGSQGAEARHLHRHRGRVGAGRRHPGQPGPDPGPHARASRPDRYRRRGIPQAPHGRGPRAGQGRGAARGKGCQPLCRALRRLGRRSGQGPRRGDDRALRRSARLCRQSIRPRGLRGGLMLSREDNEFLTRSGPGTPMGDLLRRFWMPALLSEELPERDGPPRKIKILGEDLLAFRSTDGRVGIVEPHCPHRGANLYFGRNEECGLRCAFHGWKFDVDGNCVDLPTSPPESSYKDTIKLLAYPTREWGDMIWVYMGPREKMPELPQLETGLGAGGAAATFPRSGRTAIGCRASRARIDTAHFSFLHKVPAQGREDQARDLPQHLGNRRRPGTGGSHPLGDATTRGRSSR